MEGSRRMREVSRRSRRSAAYCRTPHPHVDALVSPRHRVREEKNGFSAVGSGCSGCRERGAPAGSWLRC
eukprot:1148513-Rhodomonas_salina.2